MRLHGIEWYWMVPGIFQSHPCVVAVAWRGFGFGYCVSQTRTIKQSASIVSRQIPGTVENCLPGLVEGSMQIVTNVPSSTKNDEGQQTGSSNTHDESVDMIGGSHPGAPMGL